jgi:hypothetical protein
MRFSLLALLLISASSAFAQTKPKSFPPFTDWQIAEYSAYTKKCLRDSERVRNLVELSVTIGPDGMIIGEPEVVSPIDSDEFREDVKTALKRLHGCQPFIVDPFGRIRVQFKQAFRFQPGGLDKEMIATIEEHFRRCWTPTRVVPTFIVELKYKPDGTYAESPRLLSPEITGEHSRIAAEVIRQITKCRPLKFPRDKYYQVQSFKWNLGAVRAPRKKT